ncbi:MAG: hypothetical protein D6696_04250 [Acidobacteria bacterium]|nr:MAG: hypothetical protein D6696_04250 [Acidobacteriota bacterium]
MATSQAGSRGARRRRRERERREQAARRAETLRWWTRPGVLVFAVAVALAAAGWALVIGASRRIPVEEATVDGLHLRLEDARWILDQMDHGENFQKPSTMMPGMPEWGKQRVTLELAFENRSPQPQVFDGRELMLVPELGEEVPPMGAQTGKAVIAPGQTFNTAVHFDFDTTLPHGKLRVAWRRGERPIYLPIPEPAEHYHLRPRGGEVSLPPDARLLLPIGKPERGERLFKGVYGCIACHGDPQVPDSNNVGPHLGRIAVTAATRIDGLPAAQYVYESIIEPNAFIAPECKGGQPCAEPSAMPEYASLVDLQDVADLVAYLLQLDG